MGVRCSGWWSRWDPPPVPVEEGGSCTPAKILYNYLLEVPLLRGGWWIEVFIDK